MAAHIRWWGSQILQARVEFWAVASTRRYARTPGRFRRLPGGGVELPACQLPTGSSVNEPECQLVNHVALVQLDSVDTEPMDACNALTAPSEGVRCGRVNGVGVAQSQD